VAPRGRHGSHGARTLTDTLEKAPVAAQPRAVLARLADRHPRLKPMVVLALLVGVLTIVTVRHVTAVSRIDEREHIDFLVKAAHFQLDQEGDRPARETLTELCTRGSEYFPFPPCRPGTQEAGKYLPGGVITISDPAPYFFITGPVARVLQAISPKALPPRDSLVTWARLLGGLWLLLGCYFTIVAGDLLGVRRYLVFWALVLAIGTPALLHATTIVNPDATAFAAGAGVLLAALAWEQRRVGLWVLAVAAFAAAALKLPNTVGILIVVAFLVGRALCRRLGTRGEELRPIWDYVKAIALLMVGAVIGVRYWHYLFDFLRNHHVVGAPDTNLATNRTAESDINIYQVHSLSADELFGTGTVPPLLPPVDDIAPPIARQQGIYEAVATLARYLFVVPVLALLIAGRRFQRTLNVLSIGALVALLVTPILWILYWYYVSGTNDHIIPRYGLSGFPVLVVLLAAAAGRGRIGAWVLGVAGVTMYLAALLTNFV